MSAAGSRLAPGGLVAVCGALCACLAWAYDPSTADIAKVVGDRGGVRGGLGCGTDVTAETCTATGDVIACEGAYKGHLQGVATDGDAIFWSFTVKLVKTGLDGRVQAAIDVPHHHGDLCVKDDVVYVAVNLGRFNGEDLGISEVWTYAAEDLRKVGRWALPDCKHGAGGLTVADGHFFVVGGLPATCERNFVYEYAPDFTLVKRHELKTGFTLMGIQTAAFEDGRFVFGIYGSAGNPSGSLECPRDLKSFTRRLGPGDVGVLKLDGDYWTGRVKGNGGVLVRAPGYPASEAAYAPKRTGKGAYKVFCGKDSGWTDSGYRFQPDGYRPLFRPDPEAPNGVFFSKARLSETNAVLPAVEIGGEFAFSVPDLVRAVRRVAETDDGFAVHLNSSAADVQEALAAMRAEADGLGVRVLEATSPEIVAPDLWRIAGDFGRVEGAVACETNGFTVESHGCRIETRAKTGAQGVTARQTVVRNVGTAPVALTDLLDRWTFEGADWEVYTQSNDWQLESIGSWEPVEGVVEHRAGGMRACDGATPMMAVWNRRTNEGRVFHAVSDGMWFFRAERLPAGLRVEAGYDPRHLRWALAPGEQVALPEILTYAFTNRLDFDCHKLHAYWNARHPAREKELPAIYNTWLCRFDKLDLDFLLKQVARAKEIGFDYFVVDAGWFGPKASWGSVRGDWEERPDGWLGGRLGEVSKAVREAGMKFGFWVEPECASSGARIVKEHPEWFFRAGGGCFLDFRKPAAFDGLLETVCALVKHYEASFLKFDFNQTAAKDESGRDWADYNAAYRRFVGQVRARNPGIRIEGCASGGYMMDLSWSRTFDGFWLSDDQSLYDGVRIAKDTMLRLPPRCIERWLTLTRAHGIQPDYDGRDSRLLTTEDATWTNVRSVPLSRVEGFVAGGPFCMSCDLTTFDRNDVAHFRKVIAKTRADSAFWQRAVGRLLVDTPEATVLEYSDERLFDVRLFAISHGTRAQRLTVRPALDAQAVYRVNGRELAATALVESGLAVTAPACGGAYEVRLLKVHPQGAVRSPAAEQAPALRKHLGIRPSRSVPSTDASGASTTAARRRVV